MRDLERQLGHGALIIADVVSYCGQEMFTKMHYRAEKARMDFLDAHPEIQAIIFGHIVVLLVGDFAQLHPVKDRLLIPVRSGRKKAQVDIV